MNYVPTHPNPFVTLTVLPKTVRGYVRRYRAETQELNALTPSKRRTVLKIVRSYTFIHAEEALGEVRFRQLCRELGFSMRSPKLAWHKLIAGSAGNLLHIVGWISDDDAVLAQLAKLDLDRLHELISCRRLSPNTTAFELKNWASEDRIAPA
jgi:hypothetical protein